MAHPFPFDSAKTIQAVAFLLRREPGRRMNYMRLLKLLYIAERECLEETGKPLTGSRVVAMQRGPVLEDVLALVRGQHINTPQWAEFLHTSNYQLEMLADPGVGRLSRFVTGKLEEVAQRHEQHDEWDMVEFTHLLPEWQKNAPGTSSKEIPLSDILESVGRSQDEVSIVSGARRDAKMAEFFAE